MKGFSKGFGGGLLAIAAIGGCELVVGSRDVTVDPNWGTGGATTSGPSSSSGTGATSCVPKSTMACYTGASGTETNGTCQGGTWTCKDDGSGYGDCMGEVLPVTEDCSKKVDTDCNGFACSASEWVDQFANVQTTAVAADRTTGDVYVVGQFTSSATFGTTMFTSVGSTDIFLVKLDGTGNVAWAKAFGGTGGDQPGSLAFANGAVTMVGYSGGTLTVEGQAIPSFGAFVVRYASDGTFQWLNPCAGAASVAVDPTNGDAVVIGRYVSFNCQGQQHTSYDSDPDILASRLNSADGSLAWAKPMNGDPGTQQADATAIDSHGSIFFAGESDTSFRLGPTQISGGMYAAKLASNGANIWAKSFGLGDIYSIAVDPNDDLFLWANCNAPSNDFGGGPLTMIGASDVCIAKLKGTDGSQVWARRLGVPGSQSNIAGRQAISVDSKGDVAIAGLTQGALPIDSQIVTNKGFVAQLGGASGALHWLDGFDFNTASLSYSKQDLLAVGGPFGPGSADFGKGTISTASGQRDTFVVLIEP